MNYKNSKKVEKNLKFIQMNNKIYEGYVLEDELTGNGIIKTYDGDIYEGNFEKGELNGRGKITYSIGDIYEGEFLKNKLNGNGKIISWNNLIIYEGEFKNGKLSGKGRIIRFGDIYEGTFENGELNGKGKITYSTGDIYEGEFIEGKLNGQVIVSKSDGSIYICIFKNNELINEVCLNTNLKISDLSQIVNFIKNRNIQNIYHFTNINNLESIIKNGILSRDELENKSIAYNYNDNKRIDGYTNASCFSIEFPNYKMFYGLKVKSENQWCVIELDSSLLYEKDCIFCRHNAASSEELNRDINSRKGIVGLESMFCEEYNGLDRFNLNIPTYYPTNPQAEVLIFGKVEPKYIKRIIMKSNENIIKFSEKYKNINIEQADYLFGPRIDWQFWQGGVPSFGM